MDENKAYENYKQEAEDYFITSFLDSKKMSATIKSALTVILNLKKEPIKKGLLVYSKNYGQGKTMFFEIVNHRAARLKNKLFNQTSAKELAKIFATKGETGLEEIITCKNLFIDDLGEEDDVKRKHFGNELNVLENVILKRYELWRDKNYLTHFTTNLTQSEILERYDGKAADRLLQMTEQIEFTFVNGSFRQSSKSRLKAEFEKPKQEEKVEIFDEEKHLQLYIKYLNELIKQSKTDNLEGVDFLDFWIIYNFFERKNYPLPELTEEEKQTAKNWLRKDGKTLQEKLNKRSAVDEKDKSKNLEVVVKAMKAKKLILTLAKNNASLSETDFIQKQ